VRLRVKETDYDREEIDMPDVNNSQRLSLH